MKSLVLAGLIFAFTSGESIETEKVSFAPDFSLENLSGDKVTLSKLKGKVVLVNFWATWCGPCRRELPEFQKTYEKYRKNKKVVFLALNVDKKREVVKPFIKKNRFTFPVLYGDSKTSIDYGAYSIPYLVIIDRLGQIRFKHTGYNSQVDNVALLSSEIDQLLKEPLPKSSGSKTE